MFRRTLCVAGVLCITIQAIAHADDGQPSFRTDHRIEWTESRIQGSPDPPDPYRLQVAFPKLRFDSPIDCVPVPGTNRLAVVEHKKGISTFPVDASTDVADVMLDLTGSDFQLFAAAFHPKFAENGWAFYTYLDGLGVHLARVHCLMASGVPRADLNSRQVVFSWPTGGHTGGCIRFGPDGYLYLATGDGSGHSDTNQYAQDISDPRGSILRLDVDQSDGDKLYRVPPDNPFADRTGAVPETYAYGLRQPWKFSFDAVGRLWAGDVGQDLWEMVFLIQKGGNYGWSITEGTHPFRSERKPGPTAIVPPVVEHHHNVFRSITGGHVYTHSRLDELRDAYIYGDFDTGRVWMLRYDGDKVTDHKQLTSSQIRVVAFGQDPQGEVYVVGYASGRIYRLERWPIAQQDRPEFPRKLSETGLFASTAGHIPAAGVVPYSINAPNYADGAVVERFLGLPGDGQIEFDALLYPRGPGAPPGWRFPDGTVLAQTLSMAHAEDDVRRIETRILHHERMSGSDDDYGAQIWHGYTYVWDDDQQDAVLADSTGLDRQLTVVDPNTGQPQQLTWHIPSRNECTVCHNIAGKHVLGANTMQMNRVHDYGDVIENQLSVFQRLGLFDKPLPQPPHELPRLAEYTDEANSLDVRARSYLHANCSHCHRQWGGGNSSFQLLMTPPLDELKIVATQPAHGTFGLQNAQLVAPGDPCHSVLFYRMVSMGAARMPRLGTSTVDPGGATLIYDWIANLQPSSATRTRPEDLPDALLRSPTEPATAAIIDSWLSSSSRSLRLIRAIDSREVKDPIRDLIISRATANSAPEVRDLFDRYLPEAERVQRLGARVDPSAILTLDGDAKRGESLFFKSTSLQCQNCHQVDGLGTKLGPDLSNIGKEYDRYRLLDSIVNPSREIKPEYQVHLVETKDGQAFSGLRVPDTGDEIVLKDANNKEIRIAATNVEQVRKQEQSFMPDSLVRAMTAQQLADLIAYLSSCK